MATHIIFKMTPTQALAYAELLRKSGDDLSADNIETRIALEGPAPWREVTDRNETLGAHRVYVNETLECGHKSARSSPTGIPKADRRRCKACQDDMRRDAGWSEYDVVNADDRK